MLFLLGLSFQLQSVIKQSKEFLLCVASRATHSKMKFNVTHGQGEENRHNCYDQMINSFIIMLEVNNEKKSPV